MMSIIVWGSLGICGALKASHDRTRLTLSLKISDEVVMILDALLVLASCSSLGKVVCTYFGCTSVRWHRSDRRRNRMYLVSKEV